MELSLSSSPAQPASVPPEELALQAASDFGLIALSQASPLQALFLPSGALFALRHNETLLNQLLPGPAEDGLFRLFLRARDPAGRVVDSGSLVGAGLPFTPNPSTATWTAVPIAGLAATTTFALHPQHAAWAWRISITNTTAEPRRFDVLHAQDLGLADEGAVRNNEAYVSQYIDLLPLRDGTLGWTILARENQAAAGGRFPWLAFACATGAEAYCTDGGQFFGDDHRLTGQPAALRLPQLPSTRLQYEFALAGLQSRLLELAPGASTEVVFVARFLEHHPTASSAADLAVLRELLPADWARRDATTRSTTHPTSLFVTAPWIHGQQPTEAELARLFPGPRRHVETDAAGLVHSFFTAADTHVVTRAKEAVIARPHGHILRSGDASWIDEAQFGLTCYAAGIFAAQVYLGNTSFARLLPVVRNALNVARASGQRIFFRSGGVWQQLGVPSLFALTPGEVRWHYLLADGITVTVRVWCPSDPAASFLELRVVSGPPGEFLITHQLALGTMEFELPGAVTLHRAEGWLECHPSSETLVGRRKPGVCFAVAAAESAQLATLGGDELLYADARRRFGPYVILQTKPVLRCGVILLGTAAGAAALPDAVAAARRVYATALPVRLMGAPMQFAGHPDPGVGRVSEVLPWFNHNAAIHFSAPHGLEQYGGAAWGVRDVCQGSIEWLLTAGRHEVARRVLLTVFAQQYNHDGSWPQWFMHDPYRHIQQLHSHGDVCFWPVKALCDYVEASDDFAFLDQAVGFTDPKEFTAAGPQETLWQHCDRVIAHCESRFLAGTALVNYGDGDWDDTLQPADPTMRTRMVSAWTVGLSFHTFRQLAEVSRRAGQTPRAARLEQLLARMRVDFTAHLMPGGIVAGFLLTEADGSARPLLHPTDRVTGIRYRLLPMTRSILAELFTPEQARRHLEIVERELLYPDGVRLMSEPAVYRGGLETLFKRADTATNVGREIGLQYVHAHLRYAEALARVGDAERLWTALQVVNPVALRESVPNAAPRQSNVYFSSSDADFADRIEAAARWSELRSGRVAVRGGWRLYSSGPGLYLHKIRTCLLGLRESFGDVVFDPVLPRCLDGLSADVQLLSRPVRVVYSVRSGTFSPRSIRVNGTLLPAAQREPNPYRAGGLRVAGSRLAALLTSGENRIEIEL